MNSVRFSSNGQYLAAGTGDNLHPTGGSIKIWEVNSGKELRSWEIRGEIVSDLAFVPNSSTIVAGLQPMAHLAVYGKGDYLKLIDVNANNEVNLTGHQGAVFCVASSPDRSLIASGSGDGSIKFWKVSSRSIVRELRGFKGAAVDMAFDSQGNALVSAHDSTIKIWDVRTGKERATLQEEALVNSVLFDSAGRLIISSAENDSIALWEAKTGRKINAIRANSKAPYHVKAMSLNPKDNFFITASADDTLKGWEMPTGRLLLEIDAGESVESIAVNAEGTLAATGSSEGNVKIWTIA